MLHTHLIHSRAYPRGGLFSDHGHPFRVCLMLLLSGSLSELQKWRQATAEAEVRLSWETGAHVWTQTGTYVTPAVVTETESPHFSLSPFPPAFLLVCLLLHSVSVSPNNSPHPSRSETQSIATGFPLFRLADANKWSYCLCNDRLIGSLGCLFCYCPLIKALSVTTV